MKDSISGVVSTPPKSQTIASILVSAIVAHDLVVAEPLTALERPAEEGDLRLQAGVVHRAGADQRPGHLGRGAVGPAEHSGNDLLAVASGGPGPNGAQRQQPAVGEGDPDRPPHDLSLLAHRPAAYWREMGSCGPAG